MLRASGGASAAYAEPIFRAAPYKSEEAFDGLDGGAVAAVPQHMGRLRGQPGVIT